jgi:hypothetical protein
VCALAGNWCARQSGGFEIGALNLVCKALRWVEACFGWSEATPAALLLFSWIFIVVIAHQSLIYFRRSQPSSFAIIKSSALLAFTAFFLSFLATHQVFLVSGWREF